MRLRPLLVYPAGGTLAYMRPLRYSINVTLDGCCDHRVITPDEELHRHAVENLEQADALLHPDGETFALIRDRGPLTACVESHWS